MVMKVDNQALAEAASFRILLADNFREWRVCIRQMLEAQTEWQIFEACNGKEAVEKAATLRPEIVLLDIGMPLLNGIEAAKNIRQLSPGSQIVFLTQNRDTDIMSAAMETGAEGYILKVRAANELLPALIAIAHAVDSHREIMPQESIRDHVD